MVVAGAAEDVGWRAQIPIGSQRGIDGLLHVGAVEVDGCAGGLVVAGVYDTELGPEMRACVKNVVDVEARVYFERGVEDVGEDVAAGGGGVRGGWEGAGGWECQVFVKVGGVIAGVGAGVDVLGEGSVEVEDVGPLQHFGFSIALSE